MPNWKKSIQKHKKKWKLQSEEAVYYWSQAKINQYNQLNGNSGFRVL